MAIVMNCIACGHTELAHAHIRDKVTGRGRCLIVGCTCILFQDAIRYIDEELM